MSETLKTDVLIAGGGPAGASTALALSAYTGLHVTIIEAGALNNVKVGEQVNASLFDFLSYLKVDAGSFEKDCLIPSYNKTAAWGSSRLSTVESIFSTHEKSYQLNREEFDLLLLRNATEKNIPVFPRTRCLKLSQDKNNHWQADVHHASKGAFTIKAKILVDATGRKNSISRQAGINPAPDDQLIAAGAFFQFEKNITLQQEMLLETAKQGWWYSAVLPGNIITTTLFTDNDLLKENEWHKPERWEQLLAATTHIKEKVKGGCAKEGLWLKSAFSKCCRFRQRENFIAVGDAAASFDPISSMGIGFALSSACNAAQTVAGLVEGDAAPINTYQTDIINIYENYLNIKGHYYSREQRWPGATFWQRRL